MVSIEYVIKVDCVNCVIIFSNWTLCCFVVLFKSGKTYVLVDLVESANKFGKITIIHYYLNISDILWSGLSLIRYVD